MITIAVLGANGQVGSEVCLALSRMPGVAVVPIVRSRLGGAILERCGLTCRIGSVAEDADAKRLLEGASLVADFSLPSGLPAELRRSMRTNIHQCIRHAPRGAPYVFASTTMAFGMEEGATRYRERLVARTPYAANKRYGERLTHWYGRIHGRPTFALRLGQVFGELQNVSRGLIVTATERPLAIEGGADSPSDAVYCVTIALALQRIAEGAESRGTYTLLESPELTWREVYERHAREAGVTARFADAPQPQTTTPGALLAAGLRAATSLATATLLRNKELLVAQALPHYTWLEQRIKARHLLRRANAEVQAATSETKYVRCCAGPVPGPRLRSLGDTQRETRETALALRRLIDDKLGTASHNYHRT